MVELQRREEAGQMVSGAAGEGATFAVLTPEQRAARRAAAEAGKPIDSNNDSCCLCGLGGSLLCCDGCPAAYHLRCIGENSKSIPHGAPRRLHQLGRIYMAVWWQLRTAQQQCLFLLLLHVCKLNPLPCTGHLRKCVLHLCSSITKHAGGAHAYVP
jgi:hypothetical protein